MTKENDAAPVDGMVMRHVLCSVLEFDDGTVSCMEMHRGTLEECKELAGLIPAVCNSTGRRVVESYLAVPTEEDFDAAMAESA